MTISQSIPEAGIAQLAGLISGDLPVEQVVRRHILECEPGLPIYQAAQRMAEAQCSSIVVVEDDKAIGIWTERDALVFDFDDEAAVGQPVRGVMSSPVKCVSPNATLQEVASRFRDERVRHFLVVDAAGRRCGVVSQTDVVLHQGIEYYLKLRTVRTAIRREPVVVAAEATLGAAATQMRQNGVDAVVVRYAEGELGILTERDVVKLIARRLPGSTVGELASRPLLAIADDSSLYSARNTLIQSRVRHIGVTAADGTLAGLVSFGDILAGMEFMLLRELRTALRERDAALDVSRRHLRLAEKVIDSSLEGILITDQDARIQSVNPAFTLLTGYAPQEVIGKTPNLLASGRHDRAFYERMWSAIVNTGYWRGEVWNRRKNGEIYPERLTITAIADESGEVTHYAALFSDISELKENEERIRHLAYFDPLTGLPNRRLFYDRLSVALAHAHRGHGRLAVLFVDLDRFKRVNDSLGHPVGDALLKEVAARMLASVREDDTVARTGGDEFVVMLGELENVGTAVAVALRIIEQLQRPMQVQATELVVTCSIGIAFYPEDAGSVDELIQNADTAMYRAKDLGRSNYQLYSPAMNAQTLEHLALETGLRRALDRGQLRLFYQPVMDAVSGRLVGAEALLRWDHADLGLMPPADFIPLAEDTGLIIPIGDWVIREGCRQVRAWNERYGQGLQMAVNISPRQFHDEDFVEAVRTILAEMAPAAGELVFELTESLLMEDAIETIRTMQAIRKLGISLSMDDFGTGYSSLSYLKRFPIDTLKIDRIFIRGTEAGADDAAIVSAVVGLAHSLRLKVVAEGVEKPEQLEFLKRTGCEFVQGYLFSQPVPAAEFERQFLAGEPPPSQ